MSPPGLVSDPDPDPDSGSDPDPDSAVDPDRDSTVDSGPGTDSADRQAAADPTGLDVVPESAATDAAAVPHLSTPDSCAVPDPDGDTPPPPAPGVPVEVSVATGLLGVGLVLQLIVPVQTLLAGVPADHWGPVALALFQWFGFLAVYAFFAVSAYRGAHWARILLLVLAAVAVFGFLADMAERVFGLAAILHCVAVLLLFLPGARAHFASDDHPPR
ncbi:hypothetical protein [Actinoalloteichus fjordicus]|uniref:hypothetical protein n=1 Tax=Actinoalloteichus fjordicus TaxID=1612552 RepID=UPI0018DE1FDB|nr:hypothetical protein [Actinoalloteichus fjordicus]